MKTYTKHNFHKHTFCLWREVPFTEIENVLLNHKSKSGSGYVFTEVGVYRISNHWGKAANCRWRLIADENFKSQQTKVGFANWTDFYPNDETSKLFFIKVDFSPEASGKDVNFYHKFSLDYDTKYVLRNASETAKTIKIIKEILTETAWAKHLQFDNLDELRKEIVAQLITTEKSFLEVKKHYL
jgi:hypothetical protein